MDIVDEIIEINGIFAMFVEEDTYIEVVCIIIVIGVVIVVICMLYDDVLLCMCEF